MGRTYYVKKVEAVVFHVHAWLCLYSKLCAKYSSAVGRILAKGQSDGVFDWKWFHADVLRKNRRSAQALNMGR